MTLHSHDFADRPPSQHSVDCKPPASYFDDIADVERTMISPIVPDRRDSYATSAGPIYSPANSYWEDSQYPPSSTSATFSDKLFEQAPSTFPGHSNNPFRMDPSSYGQQQITPWPMFDRTSDSHTPVAAATYEPYGTEYDQSVPSVFPPGGPMSTPFSGLPVSNNVRPASVFPPTATPTPVSITSPPLGREWMTMAEQAIEPRPLPKRLRQDSPLRSFSPFGKRPGDGVRKKLARVDIPLDRNLHNIDSLIASSNNEDEIKELKQQKRLLRNRQAALDSRQRKKKLYEDAQEEKKHCNERVNILEDDLQALRIAYDEQRAEKESLWQRVRMLECDKENLVIEHSRETGELRKKVHILTERLNDNASNILPSLASTTSEFGEFTSDMDGLNMGSEWDELSYMNDFGLDPEQPSGAPQQQPQKPPQTPMPMHPKKAAATADDDRPVASGLLLMLLLCGAFVASKSSGSQPVIPKMSDEVRAASAVVLDSVFKDAGVAPSQPLQVASAAIDHALPPAPSPMAWHAHGQVVDPHAATPMGSHIDALSQRLMQPSKDQEAEAAFSLSANQYLSLMNDPNADPPTPHSTPSPASQHRRNLAESLKAMRDGANGASAADVFTRSLLWDRIPTDVVKEFKRFIEASESAGGGPRVALSGGITA